MALSVLQRSLIHHENGKHYTLQSRAIIRKELSP